MFHFDFENYICGQEVICVTRVLLQLYHATYIQYYHYVIVSILADQLLSYIIYYISLC